MPRRHPFLSQYDRARYYHTLSQLGLRQAEIAKLFGVTDAEVSRLSRSPEATMPLEGIDLTLFENERQRLIAEISRRVSDQREEFETLVSKNRADLDALVAKAKEVVG